MSDARAHIERHVFEGVACPCCDSHVEVYQRWLYPPMAAVLVWLVGRFSEDQRWYFTSELPVVQGRPGGGDFAKLRHWGLIVRDGRHSRWMPTKLARQWVHGRVWVWGWIHEFKEQRVGNSTSMISVHGALGDHYDRTALLRGEM